MMIMLMMMMIIVDFRDLRFSRLPTSNRLTLCYRSDSSLCQLVVLSLLMLLSIILLLFSKWTHINCRSQWPRGLRRRSSAACLLRLWVRIPPGAWIFVCCDYCVLSGRGLCDGLITRPEESYRLWRVVVCDQETSKNEEAKTRYRVEENTNTMGCNARKTNNTTYKSLTSGPCNLVSSYRLPSTASIHFPADLCSVGVQK